MLQLLSETVSAPTTWLWESWIPRGSLTLLQGIKGGGKSSFAAAIALYSMGLLELPGGGKRNPSKNRTLWVTQEETPSILKARFGRGARQVLICSAGDFPQAIQQLKQQSIDLVIIDPVTTVMAGIDCNSESAVRSFLEALSLCMHVHDCVGLLVGHFKKNGKAGKLERGIGSVAFVNVPRSVLSIEPVGDGTSLLESVACNLCARPESLCFRYGRPITFVEAPTITRPPELEGGFEDEHMDAITLLRARCSRRWVEANSILLEARNAGISPSLLRAAKRALGVKSERRLVDGIQAFWWGSYKALR